MNPSFLRGQQTALATAHACEAVGQPATANKTARGRSFVGNAWALECALPWQQRAADGVRELRSCGGFQDGAHTDTLQTTPVWFLSGCGQYTRMSEALGCTFTNTICFLFTVQPLMNNIDTALFMKIETVSKPGNS